MRSFVRFFRSRQVALMLIVAFGAVSLLGTLKVGPGQDLFTSVPFLLLSAWLALSTGVCAWERSVRAVRLYRLTPDDRAAGGHLVDSHDAGDADRAVVLEGVARALRRHRCRVVRSGDTLVAERGRWAVWASPIFHWALVALVLVVAASRLTRYEGLVGVPVGSVVVDRAASYGRLDVAPLAVSFTELDVSVLRMEEEFEARGVMFGPVPRVRIERDGMTLAEGYVRPNDPLKAGGLLIHASAYGLAAHVAVTDASGSKLATSTVLFDFDDETESGSTVSGITLTDGTGAPFEVMMTLGARDEAGNVPERLPPSTYRKLTVWGPAVAEGVTVLTPGQRLEVAPGKFLEFVDADYYARLSFVADWGPGWIYGALVVIVVTMALALLVPFRIVVVVADGDDNMIHLYIRDTSRSALFSQDIARSVCEAIETADGRDGGSYDSEC